MPPAASRLAAFVTATALAIFCGCASPNPRYSDLSSLMNDQPTSFSDEVSRDLIRQSQKLLELRDRDYLLGPDDVVEISIFEWEMREETKTLAFRISESGQIALPALGSLNVADKTVQELQALLEKELSSRNILQNPRVGVSVQEFRSRRVAIIGEVVSPGVYAIHQNVTTLTDVLTLAGGPSAGAGQVAYVLRQSSRDAPAVRIPVDLEELLDNGAFELNAVLKGGDTVYVPKAPLVFVYGNVKQPGGFSLRRSMRLLEAVAMAGGFAEYSDKRNCTLTRRSKDGQLVIPINVARVEQGKDPNPFLREGDALSVPRSMELLALERLWEVFRGIFTFTYRLDQAN